MATLTREVLIEKCNTSGEFYNSLLTDIKNTNIKPCVRELIEQVIYYFETYRKLSKIYENVFEEWFATKSLEPAFIALNPTRTNLKEYLFYFKWIYEKFEIFNLHEIFTEEDRTYLWRWLLYEEV